MHATAVTPIHPSNVIQRQDLLALAGFEDQRPCAVSFYFSNRSFQDKSHRRELIALKHLERSIVGSHFDQYPRSTELLADLDRVLESAEEMQEGSLGFKAIFACRERQIWQEFDLPTRSAIKFLQTGKYFYLVPLLRAMESCRPYCVVLAEHGKARGFVVRGTLVREIPECLPQRGLRLPADDSRVGWSHRVEGERREHAQAYLRELARGIPQFLAAQDCEDLIIGCREDLWSEIGPLLLHSSPANLLGQFHLTGFEASPAEVLLAAQPVFDVHRQKHRATLLAKVHEDPRHGALGLQAVREKLEEGRVHTLLLGQQGCTEMPEHVRCGCIRTSGTDSCESCHRAEAASINAQEVLVRKALLTGAGIVPMPFDYCGTSVEGNVAALLRY